MGIWKYPPAGTDHLRTPERIAALPDGPEPAEAGVVAATRWRAVAGAPAIGRYGAAGRKP